MNEEIEEYMKYLLNFGMVQRPKMPRFDVGAYTDNEYVDTVFDILKDMDNIDDEYLTHQHLKGE